MHEMTVKTVTVTYTGEPGDKLDQPQIAGEFILEHLRGLDSDQEHLGVLCLDSRHCLLGVKILSSGTHTEAPLDGVKLWQTAIMLRSAGIILFHNHPSGDLEPSSNDLNLTRRLVIAGRAVGIDFHDHFITTPGPVGGRWRSLRSCRAEVFS